MSGCCERTSLVSGAQGPHFVVMDTDIACGSGTLKSPSTRFSPLISFTCFKQPLTTSNNLRHTAPYQSQRDRHKRCGIPTISVTPFHHFSGIIDSFNPTMAPKRKLERKTGIHTLGGAPPSKKIKTTQTTPKATGVHTLAGSNAKSKAQPSKAAPKRGLHTLADASVGHEPTRPGRGERSFTADNENDGDYVEDGTTLDSDDDDLGPDVSNDAQGTKESNDVHDTREHQVNTEGLRLGTRSQSKAAVRHEEATRAKLMFLERLSRGTGRKVEKGVEADDGGADGVSKDLHVEV
jgi:hypothetical protein